MTECSDEELMRRYQAGEARAFEVLLRRHRTPVFHFLVRSVGDRARAEELLQDTWLNVVRSAGRYRPKASFRTWLYTIARNLCRDARRREVFRKTESLDAPARDDEHSLGDRVPDEEGATPERAAHAARLRPALEQAIAALPDEQREVFLLREGGGVPFAEIAKVTGTPENTVKSRMRYALEGLRKALGAAGIDGDLADERAAGRATRG